MVTLPFTVHPLWRAEFLRRWAQARPLLLVAFVVVQALVTVIGALALAIAAGARYGGAVASLSVLLFAPPAGYLIWFRVAGRFLVRTRFWAARVGGAGCIQVLGIVLPSAVAGLPMAALGPSVAGVAIVVGTVAAHQARRVLFAPEAGAPAAISLPIQRKLRVHPPRLLGTVTLGMDHVSWQLKPRGHYGLPVSLVQDGVPLAQITGVWVTRVSGQHGPLVAPGIPVPPGPVVVVGTPQREVVLAVDDAGGFATLLDLRRRLAASPGWSH